MGMSYDFSSILLCAEDNNSVLGLDDGDDEGEGELGVVDNQTSSSLGCGEFFMGFPIQSDDLLELLVEREVQHLPREDYTSRLLAGSLDLSIRRDAIDWIFKVHAHYGFRPLSAYLSVNYLDRFLSAYELPQGKAWMTQLLSVACLSLGAKVEETEVPLSLDLQIAEARYVFQARTIQRMELLVLGTLKWRMQAVTPFSFIDYFLYQFNGKNSPHKCALSRAVELVLSTVREIDFLSFIPSEVAAAVALSVLGESQAVDLDRALTSCKYVRKERVLKCIEVIQHVILVRNRIHKNASPATSSVPQSPIDVLDAAACRSYKSDETTVGSQTNSYPTFSPCKRRKLDEKTITLVRKW